MTKFFICILAIFTLVKLANFHTSIIAASTLSQHEMKEDPIASKANTNLPVKSVPMNMEDQESSGKGNSHTPAMDETAHIHHFHKQRIKKMKKHHGKFWLLSQLILMICHLTILYIGYLHLVSH